MPVAAAGDTATATLTVTRETIDAYADLTGDDNPLHVDDDYAAAGVFGDVVAHGMLTVGVVSAALADFPGDIVYASQNLDFEAPVHPGHEVTATVEVVEHLGGDRLRVETTATVDGGDEVVLTGEAVVLSLEHDD
jgi:3-hydroxybutyryl-CoA dehydratase